MSDKKSRKNSKLGSIEKEILEQLSGGDLFVGMLLSARNSSKMFEIARTRAARRHAQRRAIVLLKKRGLIILNDERLHITVKGEALLSRVVSKMRTAIHDNRARWDGKWRLVAFDIPEDIREARDALRFVLKKAGFLLLQQSIWVHPCDCEELRHLLAADARLSGRVIYARVDEQSDEERLLKHFGLSRKGSIKK